MHASPPAHPTVLARWQALVHALHDPRCYPHPVARVRCIETHISAVLLAGRYAYKLKKPVDLGFLDFSTLARRRRACREELRVNRRFAPALYLEVVPVSGTRAAPRVGGAGPVLEWAVRMRRFGQDALLSQRLARGRFSTVQADALGRRLAALHAAAPVVPVDSSYATAPRLWALAADNFTVLHAALPGSGAHLATLRAQLRSEHRRLRVRFAARRRAGYVRDGHGDLHLENIVWRHGAPLPFDAIEFDPALRACDVMDELAFLTMDLERRGAPAHARRVRDGYLEVSGDYAGLALLPWYQAYRALVRAKVGVLRAAQGAGGDAAAVAAPYLELAAAALRPRTRFLAITHGLSGAGKTRYGTWLLERLDLVRVRSDVERKRLLGLPAAARTASVPGGGAYTPAMTARTYAHLARCAAAVLEAGYPVLVDASFLEHRHRAAMAALAARLGVPFHILDLRAPDALLEARVRARAAAGTDASEADLAVLAAQRAAVEPLTPAEACAAIDVDSAAPYAVPAALAAGPERAAPSAAPARFRRSP